MQSAAAGGSGGTLTVAEQLETFFRSSAFKNVMGGIVQEQVKTSLKDMEETAEELKRKLDDMQGALSDNARSLSPQKSPTNTPDSTAAFPGRVRGVIYDHLCAEGVFPSFPQLGQALLLNAELAEENLVVTEGNAIREGENIVDWGKRNKKAAKVLNAKVWHTVVRWLLTGACHWILVRASRRR